MVRKKKPMLSDADLKGKVAPRTAKPLTAEQMKANDKKLKPSVKEKVSDTNLSINKYIEEIRPKLEEDEKINPEERDNSPE